MSRLGFPGGAKRPRHTLALLRQLDGSGPSGARWLRPKTRRWNAGMG